MNNSPTEAQEQAALFEWAARSTGRRPELKWLYHVPNGGSRDLREAHNLKLQGVKSGVPDICLPVPRPGFHGLYIELKRRERGRISPEQRDWITELNRYGYRAVVCRGWDEAREEIEHYLGVRSDA